MVERLSDGIVVVSANAKEVLQEAFVESIEDGIGRSQFEERWGDENKLGVSMGVFYTIGRPAVAELVR